MTIHLEKTSFNTIRNITITVHERSLVKEQAQKNQIISSLSK